MIVNEYIKSTCSVFMPIYVKLFNIGFHSGIVPDLWLIGNIIPFYKNKGNINDPQNYRPITILSCMGKLFTSILNLRLGLYLDQFLILKENQSGFRKGYSTIDSIFTLHLLFDLCKLIKKKLFCAFIDFTKAFDTVWRSGLWSKLLQNSINGKMYKVIVNMYSNIKSRIFNDSEYSEYFACEVGVRQGENLSPLLFSLYLNDLEMFMQNKNVNGLKILSEEIESELDMYINLFIILYADDTVLLSETKEDLQIQLNMLSEYCTDWKLKVNVQKSKIVIFSKDRMPQNINFYYDVVELEIVKEFSYLGVLFSRSGNFLKAKKTQVDKALSAMYNIIRKGKYHNLSIECVYSIFSIKL